MAIPFAKKRGWVVTIQIQDPSTEGASIAISALRDLGTLVSEEISCHLWHDQHFSYFHPDPRKLRDVFPRFLRAFEERRIPLRFVIDSLYSLEELESAWEKSKSKKARGKIVVQVTKED